LRKIKKRRQVIVELNIANWQRWRRVEEDETRRVGGYVRPRGRGVEEVNEKKETDRERIMMMLAISRW